MKSCDCHATCWYRAKERKYEERVKEVEKSFQQEMESMRESTKSTMLRLEADNARLRSEEEKLRDEIKHDRTVSGPLCQLLWCVSGGGGGDHLSILLVSHVCRRWSGSTESWTRPGMTWRPKSNKSAPCCRRQAHSWMWCIW